MGPVGYPETSVNTNVRCVTSRRTNISFTPRRKPEITQNFISYCQRTRSS